MTDITTILSQIEQGDHSAAEQLLPLVYDELRKLAASKLRHERAGQTLQATALVHEAYIRLVDVQQGQNWNSRGHFFAAAAEAMRRILVDEARRKRGPKSGGSRRREPLDEGLLLESQRYDEVLSISEALEKLTRESAVKAQVVKLRYFAGMTITETAAALELSRATVSRHWTYAKAFLLCELEDQEFKEKNQKE